ncbi:hypothetical protein AURDEDRAFT_168939 [Auricularia subglabra TFB-10046 SS5]|nr:hypothetical protein AURDEDRAFT_168939 [Auricularia subglabra TFB-10046 SS5]
MNGHGEQVPKQELPPPLITVAVLSRPALWRELKTCPIYPGVSPANHPDRNCKDCHDN